MPEQDKRLDYQSVCKYVGQLFLESRHELEQILQQAAQRENDLNGRISDAEKQRDDALRLVHELHNKPKE